MEQLGKYEIIVEIGRGGFGVVYTALDTTLNRIVALKILAPHLLWDPTFVARFQQEAQAAANLKHPNIVVIHELGEEQGSRYIAMEFLEGKSLDKIIVAEGALSLERVSKIVAQVASALDYAHSKGLIHRDIKPSNIIVGEDNHATLTDFGLVKAAFGSGVSSSGQVLGSPEYMAPEQAEGKPVDARTDVYELGIVLFEMLTGDMPFKADSTPALLYKQVYEAPPSIRGMRSNLAEGVEQVVNRVLAKSPDERYQTASALSVALSREFENTRAFEFRDGSKAKDLPELVHLCEASPADATWHLQEGHFERWLLTLGRDDLAQAASNARRGRGSGLDQLDQFLNATGVPRSYRIMGGNESVQAQAPKEAVITTLKHRGEATADSRVAFNVDLIRDGEPRRSGEKRSGNVKRLLRLGIPVFGLSVGLAIFFGLVIFSPPSCSHTDGTSKGDVIQSGRDVSLGYICNTFNPIGYVYHWNLYSPDGRDGLFCENSISVTRECFGRTVSLHAASRKTRIDIQFSVAALPFYNKLFEDWRIFSTSP